MIILYLRVEFEVPRNVVLVDIPYYPKNGEFSKLFIKKFEKFTDSLWDIRKKTVTKKVKQLLQLKRKISHPSSVTHEDSCACKQSDIYKTRLNIETEWEKHEDIQKDAEATKHLRNYSGHSFT